MKVGDYTIVQWSDGSIWIYNKEGEGMEDSKGSLERVVAEVFRKEF